MKLPAIIIVTGSFLLVLTIGIVMIVGIAALTYNVFKDDGLKYLYLIGGAIAIYNLYKAGKISNEKKHN